MKFYAGLALVLFLAIFTGCQKEITGDFVATRNTVDSTGGGTGSQAGTYTYYYEATIDGVNYKEIVTHDNGYIAGSGASGTDDVIVGGGLNLVDTTKKGTEFGIGKGTIHNYLSLKDADFKAFFNPGTYPYSKDAIDGVSIGWTDKDGNHWSTSLGPTDQTGSSFKITAVKDVNAVNGYFVAVTAQFNCNLYNDAGNKKSLTNGKAVVIFGKI